MPGRKIPLVSGQTYHIFNRGINRQTTFVSKREYKRFQEAIKFYQVLNPPVSLSKFLKLEDTKQNDIINLMKQKKKSCEIISYCLMPNHYHFLLKQLEDGGIAKFIGNLQNSYTKYFNIKNNKDGSLFLDQFKAVRVETDDQLLHLSRYIHLNPYTGYIVKSLEELERYPWSSFPTYLGKGNHFVDTSLVLSFFNSNKKYSQFVFNQADYQRILKEIEHLTIENT